MLDTRRIKRCALLTGMDLGPICVLTTVPPPLYASQWEQGSSKPSPLCTHCHWALGCHLTLCYRTVSHPGVPQPSSLRVLKSVAQQRQPDHAISVLAWFWLTRWHCALASFSALLNERCSSFVLMAQPSHPSCWKCSEVWSTSRWVTF